MSSHEQPASRKPIEEATGLTELEVLLFGDAAAVMHQSRTLKSEEKERYNNAREYILKIGVRGLPMLWGFLSETTADVLKYAELAETIRKQNPEAPSESETVQKRINEARKTEITARPDKKTEGAIRKANGLDYRALGIEPSAIPAVKLYMFNFFRTVPIGA